MANTVAACDASNGTVTVRPMTPAEEAIHAADTALDHASQVAQAIAQAPELSKADALATLQTAALTDPNWAALLTYLGVGL